MESARTKSLKSKVEAYFTECDATAERVTLKSGNVTIRQTPYTLAGLSEHLGVPQAEILAKGRRGDDRAESAVYAGALRRIGRYIVERALLGELQYSVAAKLLDELGTGEKLPPDEDGNRIVIVLEDKEGWCE
ncbi:MAG: terminase small subunit [Eubacteriales bacterium]|nr:terminase small subunit [Eubacteriales bacterium]